MFGAFMAFVGLRYVAAGQGTVLIALSFIRMLHLPPGHDLPEKRRRRVVWKAYLADIIQVAFGVVACCLPHFVDAKAFSDNALLGVLAAFACINVAVNLGVRIMVQAAEDAYEAELQDHGDAGDKASAAEVVARRESAGQSTLEDGFLAPPPPQPRRRASRASAASMDFDLDAEDITPRGRSCTVNAL